MEILIGALGSLAAAALIWVLSRLSSWRFRWWFSAVASKNTGVAFGKAWPNRQASAKDLARELQRSERVDVLTGRGSELQRGMFERLLSQQTGPHKGFRVLLPDINDAQGQYWIDQREQEMGTFDRSYKRGMLKNQIKNTMTFMRPQIAAGVVEIRNYSQPHIGRMIITDRVAYFTPYSADKHGRDDPVLKFAAGTPMYESMQRTFRLLWDAKPKGPDTGSRKRAGADPS